MAAAYHINDDAGLITVRAEGEVAPATLQAIGRALLEDVSFNSELPQLIDFRGLRMPGNPAALERLKAFVEQEFKSRVSGSVAVVIDDDLDARLCADVYRITCTMAGAELFEDYEQALKWIMRREFVPRPPLLQQQNPAQNRCHEPPE